MRNIPEGFEVMQLVKVDGYMQSVGPFHIRRGGDRVRIGMRIEARHCNQYDIAHGGLVTTLSDVINGFAVAAAGEKVPPMVTVSLNTDFLGTVPLGCWFDGWGEVQRMGGSLVFSRGEMYADGKLVARTSGIFKLLKKRPGA